ncbi:MAG: ATP-dependent 6-phosphofructokinase [Oscillospiraceae bacterium]|nr:ATP-dependent 6-phosphofructokinase [Oscillospiraceae bacterium]
MADKKNIRRIGVLTSGGDSPGMNAAVRAVTRSAVSRGIRVMGILKGYRGLIDGELVEYTERSVSNIINRGGTVLYSDRCDEFRYDPGIQKAADTCAEFEIDGIVVIGGDGTFRGAMDLSRKGILTAGIPATIDNDITATDYCIGFDTAMNTVIDMVDRLRDTSESHARCSVVEVMGRDAGLIALNCGIAVGASGIMIKEICHNGLGPDNCSLLDIEAEMIEGMRQSQVNGKRNFLILASEGMGDDYAELLTKKLAGAGFDARFARLAHVQRGGAPTLRDRFAATQLGDRAVELILEGKKNLIVGFKDDKVIDIDMEYAQNLDKRYKGKLSDEEFFKLGEADQKNINEHIARKQADIKKLYEISRRMSI